MLGLNDIQVIGLKVRVMLGEGQKYILLCCFDKYTARRDGVANERTDLLARYARELD